MLEELFGYIANFMAELAYQNGQLFVHYYSLYPHIATLLCYLYKQLPLSLQEFYLPENWVSFGFQKGYQKCFLVFSFNSFF